MGPWTLHEKLGSGGNATVWRATRTRGEEAALKVINTTKAQREPYRRFVQEIEFLRSLGDFPGVLTLLDATCRSGRAAPSARGWRCRSRRRSRVRSPTPPSRRSSLPWRRSRGRWLGSPSAASDTATSSRATSTSLTVDG